MNKIIHLAGQSGDLDIFSPALTKIDGNLIDPAKYFLLSDQEATITEMAHNG